MYKVFVNDKLIKLIDDYADYRSDDHTLFIRYYSKEAVAFSVDLLVSNRTMEQLVVYHDKLEELWKGFRSLYHEMTASGGLVKNENGQVLFIYKRGKWDLPKGKVDKGEAVKDTAIREVQEESGVNGVSITGELPVTYHIYTENHQTILKSTHWYEMKTNYDGPLQGDKKEGIEKVEWMDTDRLKKALKNSYPAIEELCLASLSK